MDVTVIIVSYNTAHLIVDCLESVRNASDVEEEIFVVDNASSDKSTAIISARFPAVILITNQKNKGFGAANNQALRNCRGRYVVFLNPDTTIAPHALQKALSYMETNQQTGLAGARIINSDGSLQPSISYKYPGEKFASDELIGLHGNIACVLGAFMIARKSLLDELCGFDEDFFLYGEDQDLCWRIRKRGFTIGYINDAEVLHWGGQSEIKTSPVDLFTKKLQAEYLFYQKHYSPQTIARIRESQRLKANYRLAILKWTVPFVRNKLAMQNKIECYKIALNMARA